MTITVRNGLRLPIPGLAASAGVTIRGTAAIAVIRTEHLERRDVIVGDQFDFADVTWTLVEPVPVQADAHSFTFSFRRSING